MLLTATGITSWWLVGRGPADAAGAPAAVDGNASTAPANPSVAAAAAPAARPTGTAEPGAGGPTSRASAVPALPYTSDELADAAAVATQWLQGVSSIRWDEDQAARTARLSVYLTDQRNAELLRWLTPSASAMDDIVASQTVITANAAATEVDTMTPESLLLRVHVEQTTTRLDEAAKPVSSDWLITLSPSAGTWTVTALIEAGAGDPGY